ncbi:MAG: RNA polymerase sigma-70 factor [Tannerellaceae bacterium]|jgi:RNA polymerase sigma-70 factor (ECF subfamily)|nr:RNA polymerase sigma-70 factor [Tannerellaceae bacterium]
MPGEAHNKQDLKRLNKLIRQYEKPFIQFAYSYIENIEAAEDYVFESFMEYWENRHMVDNDKNVNIPAYIIAVIKHKCLNHLRHEMNHVKVSEKIRNSYQWELNLQINSLESCEPKELLVSEIHEIVEQALKKLPSDTRYIFYLSRFENKSRKEIAQVMNMSIKGVEYHIAKTLRLLRLKLKDFLF